MSLAIVPGSFDPMTLGHLDLVCKVREQYDEVVVAVMVNDQKTPLFDMQTRVEIARRTVAGISGVRVISDTGMLVDLFDRLHADAVCKGYRNDDDLQYEKMMAEWNREHNPRFQTVFYPASEAYASLSSTEVRQMLKSGVLPSGLVHPDVYPIMKSKFGVSGR